MKAGGSLSIWFFIGLSLAVNGAIILGEGIYEIVSPPPPEAQVVLANLHANVWWGGILFLLGAFYSWRFSPAQERKRISNS